jgi:hypothetical protein
MEEILKVLHQLIKELLARWQFCCLTSFPVHLTK